MQMMLHSLNKQFCFSFKYSALLQNCNSKHGIKHKHSQESKAFKIQASLNCHKNPIQSNIPGTFTKNDQQSPTAEASTLLFSMQVWGGGAHLFLDKTDGCFICWLSVNSTDSYKPRTWLSTELLWNHTLKEISEQTSPHLTQLLHEGHHRAMCTHSTSLTGVGKSLTCNNRVWLRPGNICSQICRSRAGYIGFHVI